MKATAPCVAAMMAIMFQSIQAAQYKILATPTTWDNAQAACQAQYGTDLASIHSESDNAAVKALCDTTKSVSQYSCWIGLRRYGQTWKWADGSEFEYGSDVSGGKAPWNNGEPNNVNGRGEECATLLRSPGRWNDQVCDAVRSAVCNALSRQLETIDSKVASLEAKDVALDSAIKAVDSKVEGAVSDLSNGVSSLKQKDQALSNDMSTMSNSITALRQEDVVIKADIASMKPKAGPYQIITTVATWDDAQAACQAQFGTDLASIHSESDNAAVKALCNTVSGTDACWIGFRRYGQSWKWSDGSVPDYGSDVSGGKGPWSAGNPSNSGGGEACVGIFKAAMSNGEAHPHGEMWNDFPCSWRKAAVCDSLSRQLDGVGTKLSSLQSQDASLDSSIKAVDGKLNGQVALLNGEIDELTAQIEKIDKWANDYQSAQQVGAAGLADFASPSGSAQTMSAVSQNTLIICLVLFNIGTILGCISCLFWRKGAAAGGKGRHVVVNYEDDEAEKEKFAAV